MLFGGCCAFGCFSEGGTPSADLRQPSCKLTRGVETTRHLTRPREVSDLPIRSHCLPPRPKSKSSRRHDADFAERPGDRERCADEGRFWKGARAFEKQWRDPDNVYSDVERREEEPKMIAVASRCYSPLWRCRTRPRESQQQRKKKLASEARDVSKSGGADNRSVHTWQIFRIKPPSRSIYLRDYRKAWNGALSSVETRLWSVYRKFTRTLGPSSTKLPVCVS